MTSSTFVSWIAAPVLGLPEKESGWPEGFGGKGGGRHQGDGSLEEGELNETEEVGTGYRGGLGASFDAVKTIEVVAQYGSIMILIATVTGFTEALILKRKEKEVVAV